MFDSVVHRPVLLAGALSFVGGVGGCHLLGDFGPERVLGGSGGVGGVGGVGGDGGFGGLGGLGGLGGSTGGFDAGGFGGSAGGFGGGPPESDVVWLKTYGNVADDWVTAFISDEAGGAFISGNFTGTMDLGNGLLTSAGSNDMFLAHLDTNGVSTWSKRYGSASADEGGPQMAVHPDGVVICGTNFTTLDFGGGPHTANGADLYVALLDPNGDLIWEYWIEQPGEQRCWGTPAVSPVTGDVFVPGLFGDQVVLDGQVINGAGDGDAMLLRLNGETGALEAHRTFGAPGQDHMRALAAMPNGDVVATAFTTGGTIDLGLGPESALARNVILARYDRDLEPVWANIYQSPYNSEPNMVIRSDAGDLIVAGRLTGGVDFGSGPIFAAAGGFVARVSADYGFATDSVALPTYNSPSKLVETPNGELVVLGYFTNELDLGGVQKSAGNINSVQADHLAVKLSPDLGTIGWVQLGADNVPWEPFVGGALDGAGNVMLSGTFYESMTIGDQMVTSQGINDFFILKRKL